MMNAFATHAPGVPKIKEFSEFFIYPCKPVIHCPIEALIIRRFLPIPTFNKTLKPTLKFWRQIQFKRYGCHLGVGGHSRLAPQLDDRATSDIDCDKGKYTNPKSP